MNKMSIVSHQTKWKASVGGEDSWRAPVSRKEKPKPVFMRENISLMPVEIIVQQFGTNYVPPRKAKEKKP